MAKITIKISRIMFLLQKYSIFELYNRKMIFMLMVLWGCFEHGNLRVCEQQHQLFNGARQDKLLIAAFLCWFIFAGAFQRNN